MSMEIMEQCKELNKVLKLVGWQISFSGNDVVFQNRKGETFSHLFQVPLTFETPSKKLSIRFLSLGAEAILHKKNQEGFEEKLCINFEEHKLHFYVRHRGIDYVLRIADDTFIMTYAEKKGYASIQHHPHVTQYLEKKGTNTMQIIGTEESIRLKKIDERYGINPQTLIYREIELDEESSIAYAAIANTSRADILKKQVWNVLEQFIPGITDCLKENYAPINTLRKNNINPYESRLEYFLRREATELRLFQPKLPSYKKFK